MSFDRPGLPIDQLPSEVLLKLLCERGTAESVSALMLTSKELHERITLLLRNPLTLLTLLSHFPAVEIRDLIRSHFAKGSANYQAIEAAYKNSQELKLDVAAVVAYAFITDDIKLLDRQKLERAIRGIERMDSRELDPIKNSLVLMLKVINQPDKVTSETEGRVDWQTELQGQHSYLNLSGADCRGGIFFKKDLRGMNFSRARLRRAGFNYVESGGVSFAGADLVCADFYNAKLPKANFCGAVLTQVSLHGTDLSGTKFIAGNISDIDEFKRVLTQLNQYSIPPEFDSGDFNNIRDFNLSRKEIVDLMVKNILRNVEGKSNRNDILQAAYEHPLFGTTEPTWGMRRGPHERAQTAIKEFINSAASFFKKEEKVFETEAQKALRLAKVAAPEKKSEAEPK